MVKVKLVGDINFEFDVIFHQKEDISIETKAITVDGGIIRKGKFPFYIGKRTIYVGKGNVENIDPKAFNFIVSMIEQFLKKNSAYILDIYASLIYGDKDFALINTIYNEEIEPLKTILIACRLNEAKAVNKMLQDGWFLISHKGINKYIDKYYKKKYIYYR